MPAAWTCQKHGPIRQSNLSVSHNHLSVALSRFRCPLCAIERAPGFVTPATSEEIQQLERDEAEQIAGTRAEA